MSVTTLDGSLPDIRGRLAAVIDGVIPRDHFPDGHFATSDTIEFEGSEEEVDLLNLLFHLYAEYSSDSVDASALVDAFRTDPLAQQELAAYRAFVA